LTQIWNVMRTVRNLQFRTTQKEKTIPVNQIVYLPGNTR